MEMNLRNARRVEREAESAIQLLTQALTANVNPVVSAFGDFDTLVAQNQERVGQTIRTITQLTRTRTDIRRAIEVANETSTINQLISETVFLKNIIGLAESVVGVAASDLTQAKAQLAAQSSAPGAAMHQQQIRLMNVTDAGTLSVMKTELQRNKEALFRAKEEIAALNSSTRIKVADWQVPVLQEAGIILA